MLRKFVEGKPGAKRYKVSALKKDTLISYIIILALVVQDFQAISVEALAMELGLKISKYNACERRQLTRCSAGLCSISRLLVAW